MKVFISGKMTGLTPEEYGAKFSVAAKKLQAEGYEVFNPSVPEWNDRMHDDGLSYGDILINDFKKIMEYDALYMLDNWKESKGSTAEHAFANAIGMKIMYERPLPNLPLNGEELN